MDGSTGGKGRAERRMGWRGLAWRGVCVLLNGNPEKGGNVLVSSSLVSSRLACLVRSSSLFGHSRPLPIPRFHSRHIYIAYSLPPFTLSCSAQMLYQSPWLPLPLHPPLS